MRLDLLPFVREEFDDVFGKAQRGALRFLPLFQHLQVGEAIGPRQEGSPGIVICKLPGDREAGFLKDITGIRLIRKQREDVAEKRRLMLREKRDQQLGSVRGFFHVH